MIYCTWEFDPFMGLPKGGYVGAPVWEEGLFQHYLTGKIQKKIIRQHFFCWEIKILSSTDSLPDRQSARALHRREQIKSVLTKDWYLVNVFLTVTHLSAVGRLTVSSRPSPLVILKSHAILLVSGFPTLYRISMQAALVNGLRDTWTAIPLFLHVS